MLKQLFYFILISNIYASNSVGPRLLLFTFFLGLALAGCKFITIKSGNYDVDYFTKIIGWLLLIPAIIGILDSLRIL
tara:strand:+ start:540 stop:770 length:231 start_codon:yes stop_codon:yes gene_type:complete